MKKAGKTFLCLNCLFLPHLKHLSTTNCCMRICIHVCVRVCVAKFKLLLARQKNIKEEEEERLNEWMDWKEERTNSQLNNKAKEKFVLFPQLVKYKFYIQYNQMIGNEFYFPFLLFCFFFHFSAYPVWRNSIGFAYNRGAPHLSFVSTSRCVIASSFRIDLRSIVKSARSNGKKDEYNIKFWPAWSSSKPPGEFSFFENFDLLKKNIF